MQFSPLRLPAALALTAALGLATVLQAEETPALSAPATFTSALTPATQTSAGLNTLSTAQRKEIDRLVSREITLAKEGNVRAFGGTFISRRKPAELDKTGIAKLSPAQKDELNTLVATAIANRPDDAASMVYSPKREGDEPMAVAMQRKLIVHGGMSFTAGWGSNGSNFQSASAYSSFTDPQSKTTVAVAVSSTRGKGYFGYPGYYPYDDGLGLGLGYPYYDDFIGQDYYPRRGLGPILGDYQRY